jgi:hypothetical protein
MRPPWPVTGTALPFYRYDVQYTTNTSRKTSTTKPDTSRVGSEALKATEVDKIFAGYQMFQLVKGDRRYRNQLRPHHQGTVMVLVDTDDSTRTFYQQMYRHTGANTRKTYTPNLGIVLNTIWLIREPHQGPVTVTTKIQVTC